ncbi:MAG: hypothetical protein M0007_13480 [Actinomycetota bacterium]|nr:hypothetical protein [Actinomycetota bacterium]
MAVIRRRRTRRAARKAATGTTRRAMSKRVVAPTARRSPLATHRQAEGGRHARSGPRQTRTAKAATSSPSERGSERMYCSVMMT